MQSYSDVFAQALSWIVAGNPDLVEIVLLSLKVSLTATILACIIGMLLGAVLAITRFWGKGVVVTVLNAMMGLPPVVVGLIVYLHLSRIGPFGHLGLLYTPTAMIIAQVVLITPIVAALSYQVLGKLHAEYADAFRSMRISRPKALTALLWDGRFALVTVGLAGFGRAIAEVGAVMIVGGNIDHATRLMTTAIALETSKGNLTLALALGIVLLIIALSVNMLAMGLRSFGGRYVDD